MKINNSEVALHDEVLLKLKGELNDPSYSCEFKKGDGTESGEPSLLIIERFFRYNSVQSSTYYTTNRTAIHIAAHPGDAMYFSNYLGVNIYDIVTPDNCDIQIIDGSLNSEVTLNVLKNLLISDSNLEFLPDQELDVGGVSKRSLLIESEILGRLLPRMKSEFQTVIDRIELPRNTKIYANHVWINALSTYYVIGPDNIYKSRVLVYYLPHLSSEHKSRSIVVQIRRRLGENVSSYYVGRREIASDTYGHLSYITSFPNEVYCESFKCVQNEVRDILKQEINNLMVKYNLKES